MNRAKGAGVSAGVVCILLCVCLAVCTAVVSAVFGERGHGDGLAMDANAVSGVMPGVDRQRRMAELQEKLDDSLIAFSVNTDPVFADGGAEGNVLIENPEQNEKLLIAEIYLDDTGELVYRSDAIPPGAYIAGARLDQSLSRGDYPATVYLKGYALDTETYIGQAGAKIEIHVEN